MRKTVYYTVSIPRDEYEETYTTYYGSREEAVTAAQAIWDEMDFDTQSKRIVIACKAVMEVGDQPPEDDSWGDEGGVYGNIVVGPNILKEFRMRTKKRRK